MFSKTLCLTAVLCGLGCMQSNCDAAIIDGFAAVRHARFTAEGDPNSGFFVDESQLSGLAYRSAVLISPRHYVTANHIAGDTATFLGIDGIERTYMSSSSQRLLTNVVGEGLVGSDIRVHRLDNEVDPAIRPLPIIVGSDAAFVGREVIAFEQHSWAGRNIIDAVEVVEFDNGTGDTNTIRFSYDTDTNGGTGGLGIDEIGLLSGDSGSTGLMMVDGTLGIIGTHMGIDVPDGKNAGAGDRYDSFTTVLSGYEDQLTDILSADNYQLMKLSITAIPEPSFFVLLGFAFVGMTVRRIRRA